MTWVFVAPLLARCREIDPGIGLHRTESSSGEVDQRVTFGSG